MCNNNTRIFPNASALVIVDAQQGFSSLCPAEFPVPGALEIVPAINELLEMSWARVDATQDWHPPDHCSFIGGRDNLFPAHCVMGTTGADFLPGLLTERFHTIWRKGYLSDRDAYAVTAQHPIYVTTLRAAMIRTVLVCGLAANIGCFLTARDLRKAGFQVVMVEDAMAGIDVPLPNFTQVTANEEGRQLGIHYLRVADVKAAVSA
jgi:nicotinamidase/pyrazinamidase